MTRTFKRPIPAALWGRGLLRKYNLKAVEK